MSGIDIAPYLTIPNVNVAGGVALGVALLAALPKGAPAPVVRAAKTLREKTVALQAAWQATHSEDGASADRPAADHRVDIAWNALYGRLSSYAQLPAETYPAAGKAARLQGRIFDDGLRFLILPYAREWAESDRRLKLIKDEKLEPGLRELVGDDVVDEVKQAHEEYGVALGITEAQAADPSGVQEPLRDLQAAVRDYALQVVAAGNDGDAFAGAASAALSPIDRVRAAQNNKPAAPADAPAASPAAKAPPAPLPAVTPTSPVPQVSAG